MERRSRKGSHDLDLADIIVTQPHGQRSRAGQGISRTLAQVSPTWRATRSTATRLQEGSVFPSAAELGGYPGILQPLTEWNSRYQATLFLTQLAGLFPVWFNAWLDDGPCQWRVPKLLVAAERLQELPARSLAGGPYARPDVPAHEVRLRRVCVVRVDGHFPDDAIATLRGEAVVRHPGKGVMPGGPAFVRPLFDQQQCFRIGRHDKGENCAIGLRFVAKEGLRK